MATELIALLHDPDIREIVVNNDTEVWVERTAGLSRLDDIGAGEAAALIERLLAPLGRRVDLSSPVVDARLGDGSRLCAAIPPVSPHGLNLAIRRFARGAHTLASFTDARTADLVESALHRRLNIVVAGGTSTGKTTLLGAMAELLPSSERIIVLEDTNELRIRHPHTVYLETRPASTEGVAAIELCDLVRHALRLRPDRLIVGEVRGGEAFDMLQAMNTGHSGSLATCHANSAVDTLHRIESMVLRAIANWPLSAVRSYLASAIDIVVYVERTPDGARRIADIVRVDETLGSDGGFITSPLLDD
ncbi:MAG: CpaF family protein [Actinobacteria bacterium]|nr:CpaF family protein [Actinomycetota bacterium]